MVCNGSKSFKIAAKCLISSHRVAGLMGMSFKMGTFSDPLDVHLGISCLSPHANLSDYE